MPSLLHYEIVTDPTSLRASLTNEPSLGTVYVIVSNTHQAEVKWDHIDVAIPLLNLSSNLTDNPSAVTASIERTYQHPLDDALEFAWDSVNDCFRARLSRAQPPTRKHALLAGHGALVLKLENVPVSEGAGLSLLEIRDNAYGGDGGVARRDGHFTTHLGLVKQTPQVPRNFRPEKSLVNGDANEQLVLLWDGPTDLNYDIVDQTGTVIHQEPAVGPGYREYSPKIPAPKRGTTYTLVANAPGAGQQQRGYFLTTTVHAVVPEFESGTRTPWVEGTTDKGRVTFATNGVKVQLPDGRLGTVTADDVTTRLVQGLTDDAGWMTFPNRGVNIYHGHNATPGILTAARVDAEEGVNTPWVGSREAGQSWIAFTEPGATLYKDNGGQERGTFTAEKVDVHGLNTTWVGDRDGGKGWVEFPQSGINVRKDGGGAWGNIAADKADLNGINTKWVQGPGTGDGWIEFPESGLNVFHGQGRDWGTVAAGKADVNDLVTGTALVKKRLTVKGGMTVSEGHTRALFTHPNGYVGIDTGMEVKGRDGQGYVFRVNEGGEYGVLVNGPLAVTRTIYVGGENGGGRFL
ncbi:MULTISPECIES: hypothetical protein [Kitasatospora]|uniref:Fibronectin type-III domain-containing protein n=1 Tax=Kitasatospora cathayae TaxID=3004092 RepID=A0ABY7PVV8_9ACTN|nr:hypothetical protein [Kitasatospora sp. HUAS 3-15]WBP84569.1 hypothetical protein O1G21_00965 [Kitasatospora sp. HUAS 3-15]